MNYPKTYVLNILLNEQRTKCLMQLKDRTVFAGKYNFPGGKVNTGRETADEAALRELAEETGVTKTESPNFHWIGAITVLRDCVDPLTVHHAELVFYAGTVDEAVPAQQPGETERLKWMTFEEVERLREKGMLAGDGEVDYFLRVARREFPPERAGK